MPITSSLFGNAVTAAVTKTNEKLATLEPDAIARLEETATLEFRDWYELGELASRALLAGHVDADTAQTIYVIHTRFNSGASLAERLVFLQVAEELLSARLAWK
jgi:hypothetical protein